MTGAAPPLRFLVLVVGGWICARAAFLALDGRRPAAPAPRAAAVAVAPLVQPPFEQATAPESLATSPQAWRPRSVHARVRLVAVPPLGRPDARAEPAAAFIAIPGAPPRAPILVPSLSAAPGPSEGRWSVSAWLLLRKGRGEALAGGATLGGSQWGGRVGYRLNADPARPFAASLRIYSPLDGGGAEAALGLEWKLLASLPVRLLAERRVALEDGGRNAFSLLAHGGVSGRRVAGPVLLDGYGQAGVVGLRSRDLFIDGAATLSVPIRGGVQAGIGLWGAAQPDVSRLDAGPQVSVVLPVSGTNARLLGAWRMRLAGDAAPGSGPALTLGADF